MDFTLFIEGERYGVVEDAVANGDMAIRDP